MLQPSRADSSPDSRPDFNPLDAFERESAEDLPERSEVVFTLRAGSPVHAAPEPDRLEVAEAEIVKLQSKLATLVGVIDDITRQLRLADRAEGARTERQVRVARLLAMPRRPTVPRILRGAPFIGAIAGLALGIMTWRAFTTVEVPEAPPSVAEPSPEPVHPPAQPPAAVSVTQPGPAPIKAAAVVTPVPNSPARPIEPRLYVGSLSIDASPGGEVFVDRKSAGMTPVRVDKLRAGSHLVWIERDGYRRWTKVVQVPADQVSRVFADLEPIDGR